MLVYSFLEMTGVKAIEANESYSVELQSNVYKDYMEKLEEHWQMEKYIILNEEHPFPCC